MRGSMNMQMSPAPTHSLSLKDPLVDDHTLNWSTETPAISKSVFETAFGSLQF